MNIALTGHKGFIGSHYLKYLRNDHQVFTFDKSSGQDLNEYKTIANAPIVDVVVHMAATNGTRLFYEKPTEVSFNNTIPTFNLIKKYMGTNTKFVFASTCEIFNSAIDKGLYPVPTDEKVPIMFEEIINPRWSYSLPKALGENLVANSGLPWLVLRYFNIYGPKQIDHFITEFVSRIKKGEYYIKGNDTRSFCYIDDAIEMTHRLVKNHNGLIVNIGREEENTISDVAKIIMDIMGIDPKKLKILPGPKGSVKRRCPDTKLVKKLTGFTNFTKLEHGLKITLESFA